MKFNSLKQIKQLPTALATGSWFVMHELMGNNNVKMYDGSMHLWMLEKRPVTAMKME